ncbi:MAG: DUF2127 domain-containing protein [bacterium]
MFNKTEEKELHIAFEVGVIVKAIITIGELVGGTILCFLNTERIQRIVYFLTADELNEDPYDKVSLFIKSVAERFTPNERYFAMLYLFSHGAVKIFLVGGLWKNKLWAYPASIVVFTLFVAYQIYRYTFSHSILLIALTVFDVIFIALTIHEYVEVRRKLRG